MGQKHILARIYDHLQFYFKTALWLRPEGEFLIRARDWILRRPLITERRYSDVRMAVCLLSEAYELREEASAWYRSGQRDKACTALRRSQWKYTSAKGWVSGNYHTTLRDVADIYEGKVRAMKRQYKIDDADI